MQPAGGASRLVRPPDGRHQCMVGFGWGLKVFARIWREKGGERENRNDRKTRPGEINQKCKIFYTCNKYKGEILPETKIHLMTKK